MNKFVFRKLFHCYTLIIAEQKSFWMEYIWRSVFFGIPDKTKNKHIKSKLCVTNDSIYNEYKIRDIKIIL